MTSSQPYRLSCPNLSGLQVHAVPYLSDNFGYVIVDEASKQAALVDVVDPEKFASYVKTIGCEVTYILTTHYHADHQGGNKNCVKFFPGVPVYKSKYEPTDGTHDISDGDILKLGKSGIQAIHTPTHTKGHISYFITNNNQARPALACTGDFLFVGGCGRFFEGTAETMIPSIEKIYNICGEDTYMLPGHDYGVNNLKFALTVEPNNSNIASILKEFETNKEFVPSKFGEELTFNPFVRCVLKYDEFQCAEGLDKTSKSQLLQTLRNRKDKF